MDNDQLSDEVLKMGNEVKSEEEDSQEAQEENQAKFMKRLITGLRVIFVLVIIFLLKDLATASPKIIQFKTYFFGEKLTQV